MERERKRDRIQRFWDEGTREEFNLCKGRVAEELDDEGRM